MNKVFLLLMIRRVRLNNEPLNEIVMPGMKPRTVTIEIDLVGHVIEGPDTVALTAIET